MKNLKSSGSLYVCLFVAIGIAAFAIPLMTAVAGLPASANDPILGGATLLFAATFVVVAQRKDILTPLQLLDWRAGRALTSGLTFGVFMAGVEIILNGLDPTFKQNTMLALGVLYGCGAVYVTYLRKRGRHSAIG